MRQSALRIFLNFQVQGQLYVNVDLSDVLTAKLRITWSSKGIPTEDNMGAPGGGGGGGIGQISLT